jgi:hypothetical protein
MMQSPMSSQIRKCVDCGGTLASDEPGPAHAYHRPWRGGRSPRESEVWTELVVRADAVLRDSTHLGGHGFPLTVGQQYDLVFRPDALTVFANGDVQWSVSIADVREADISGRGVVTRGTRLIGGGFGLEGAAIGIGIASVLNSLTTRTEMETVLRIRTSEGEAFFHYGSATPAALRITLSRFFGSVAANRGGSAVAAETSLVDEFERLAALRREGMISDIEFLEAKQRLLDGQ